MTQKRLGFACKLSVFDQKKGVIAVPQYNTTTTTVSWLNRQTPGIAEERLWTIMRYNLHSLANLVLEVGSWTPELRMVRLPSDILPVYTEPTWSYFWKLTDVRDYVKLKLEEIGKMARRLDVKLSFHPGQFCCIVSDREDVVLRSIEELEYHADIVRWLGYGKTKLDFKINIHLSGRLSINGFDSAWSKMSPELQNCLTIENDEYQAGLDQILPLANRAGIVLDIHHHLIKDHEYIKSNDDRIKRVIDSWQGRRPTLHYSQSHENYISSLNHIFPSMEDMLALAKKSKLRAHSEFFPNKHINEWALSHLEWGDIMAECKSKNLGSLQLFHQAKELSIY